jgi:hypothetical protein
MLRITVGTPQGTVIGETSFEEWCDFVDAVDALGGDASRTAATLELGNGLRLQVTEED